MENKEDYVGYEDQELCNRYYKEAEAMRQKQDWSRLRAVPAPAKGTPSPGWGDSLDVEMMSVLSMLASIQD